MSIIAWEVAQFTGFKRLEWFSINLLLMHTIYSNNSIKMFTSLHFHKYNYLYILFYLNNFLQHNMNNSLNLNNLAYFNDFYPE